MPADLSEKNDNHLVTLDDSSIRFFQNGTVDDEDKQMSSHFLEPFRHQVGGHVGLLCWDARHLCKPFTKRESAFYLRMSRKFAEFVPAFCGTVDVSLEPDSSGYMSMITNAVSVANRKDGQNMICSHCNAHKESLNKCTSRRQHLSKYRFRLKKGGHLEVESFSDRSELFRDLTSGVHNMQNPWAFYCQTRHVDAMRSTSDRPRFMLLENLVSRFGRPCVVDLKMGTRQYGDGASLQKQLVQTTKCQSTTSAKLGVRIVGMQIYDPQGRVYLCTDKHYGRRLDPVGFHRQFRLFLVDANGRVRRLLCLAFLRRINALTQMIRLAEGHRFFSASLLLLYDAEGGREDDRSDVRMIDFEHATFPGLDADNAYTGVDDGYLLGLRTLRASLTSVINESDSAI